VKELEEDIALVGGQHDALNIQVRMASAHVRTLEDEVVTLKGTVRERDEALLGTGREIEVLKVVVHDKDEALQASSQGRRLQDGFFVLDALRIALVGVLVGGPNNYDTVGAQQL
jgi:hypothetical protein